ncbi:unnamed protein product [Alternaria alternata]
MAYNNRPPPTNQGRQFIQHPIQAPNAEIAARIGLPDDAERVYFRKARQVFFRDQDFNDGNIEAHILPEREASSYQFGLIRRQMQDLQGNLQSRMWASPEVIASNNHIRHLELDHPAFEVLTWDERAPHFEAAFNKQLLAKITAPVQQAVDIRRIFEQDNGIWFHIYQKLYLTAANTAWNTAEWEILDEGYFPPFNRSLLYANVREAMQHFENRPGQDVIPVLQTVFGTVFGTMSNRFTPTFTPTVVQPINEAAWRAPW